MGYSKFIQELNEGIEGKMAAYSRRDNEEGCLIYLKNLDQKIFVHADVIERRYDEVILVLRAKIRQGISATPALVLTQAGNNLVFEEETTMRLRTEQKR